MSVKLSQAFSRRRLHTNTDYIVDRPGLNKGWDHFHQQTTFIKQPLSSKANFIIEGGQDKTRLGAKNNIVRISVKASPAGLRRFHRNTAYARLMGFNRPSCGHRLLKAGDVPHEGLLKVKRLGGLSVLGFGSFGFWVFWVLGLLGFGSLGFWVFRVLGL